MKHKLTFIIWFVSGLLSLSGLFFWEQYSAIHKGSTNSQAGSMAASAQQTEAIFANLAAGRSVNLEQISLPKTMIPVSEKGMKHCHDKQFVKSSSAFCPGAYEHVL